MVCKCNCATIVGVDIVPVVVETDISSGLPSFDMVGLLSSDIKEARERVRTALKNSGFLVPPARITINFAPGDLRKSGTNFDIAVAVSILHAMGVVNADVSSIVFVGELSLDGRTVPVRGVLPMVLNAIEEGMEYCFIPKDNIDECRDVRGIGIIPVEDLNHVVRLLMNVDELEDAVYKCDGASNETRVVEHKYDFADIFGQEGARKAAEIAAAGMHNFLMIGEPGTGKSVIAKAMPSIMPDLSLEESIAISKIHSVAGLLNDGPIRVRPFRSPHHTITSAAMMGGGSNPRPGEVALAHGGVLFLDELPEFSRSVMESLRQPLEDGVVRISRTYGDYEFPTEFMLLGAMNPCKCGYYPDRNRCSCSEREVAKYMDKVSGPIMDRIDLQVRVNSVPFNEIHTDQKMESSAEIKKRVEAAVLIQRDRYKNESFSFNSQLSGKDIKKYCRLSQTNRNLLEEIYEKFQLSVRSYEKILKVARTIADLDKSDEIKEKHLMMAVGYKVMGRE